MTEELDKLSSIGRIKPVHHKPTPATTSQPTKLAQRTESKTTSKNDQSLSTFGGFKKGFLSGGSEQSRKKQSQEKAPSKPVPSGPKPTPTGEVPVAKQSTVTSEHKAPQAKGDVPYIKPKSKASGLELPEVQEAMRETFPFLETQGV